MKEPVSMSREELVAELLAVPYIPRVEEASVRYATVADINAGAFRVAVVSHKLLVAKELLLRDLIAEMKKGPCLNSPSLVRDWLRLHCAGLEHEVFIVLFLDVKNCLLAAEEMFRGSLTETSVHPREIVKAALRHNAGSVIVAHNHPSGCAEPSARDQVLTRDLVSALALIDVKLIDHLVVGGFDIQSFAERGEL